MSTVLVLLGVCLLAAGAAFVLRRELRFLRRMPSLRGKRKRQTGGLTPQAAGGTRQMTV
jgi:hypothetical protein